MTARRRFDIRQAGRALGVLLGIWAVLNLGYYATRTRPKVREYNQLRTQHGPVFEKLKTWEERVVASEAFLAAVGQAETDLARMQDEILSTREARMVEVRSALNDLCGKFNIPCDSVGLDHEELIDEELDRMAMDVPLEGNYRSLRNFLQAVESSDKFLLVERVALARGKEGGVLLSLNIGLATYFNLPEHLTEKKRKLSRTRPRRRS